MTKAIIREHIHDIVSIVDPVHCMRWWSHLALIGYPCKLISFIGWIASLYRLQM